MLIISSYSKFIQRLFMGNLTIRTDLISRSLPLWLSMINMFLDLFTSGSTGDPGGSGARDLDLLSLLFCYSKLIHVYLNSGVLGIYFESV